MTLNLIGKPGEALKTISESVQKNLNLKNISIVFVYGDTYPTYLAEKISIMTDISHALAEKFHAEFITQQTFSFIQSQEPFFNLIITDGFEQFQPEEPKIVNLKVGNA
jgi:hypothetical protein